MKKMLLLVGILAMGMNAFGDVSTTVPVNVTVDVTAQSNIVIVDDMGAYLNQIDLHHNVVAGQPGLSEMTASKVFYVTTSNATGDLGADDFNTATSETPTTVEFELMDSTLDLSLNLAATLELKEEFLTILGTANLSESNLITSTLDPAEVSALTNADAGSLSAVTPLTVTVK